VTEPPHSQLPHVLVVPVPPAPDDDDPAPMPTGHSPALRSSSFTGHPDMKLLLSCYGTPFKAQRMLKADGRRTLPRMVEAVHARPSTESRSSRWGRAYSDFLHNSCQKLNQGFWVHPVAHESVGCTSLELWHGLGGGNCGGLG